MRILRSTPGKRTWRVAAAILCFSLAWIACPAAHGAGVAAYKEQPFHSDDLATMIVYSTVQEGAVSYLFDLGSKEVSLERTKIAGYVTVPELPANIRDDEATAQLRKSFETLSAFAARFKKAVPVLQPYIDQLKTALSRRALGDVRYEGRWLSGDEYAVILRKEMEVRAVAAKEELERQKQIQIAKEEERAFIAEQRAKGLERYKDKWLPRQEVEELKVASDQVTEKSIKKLVYGVFQVLPEGMLVKTLDGAVRHNGLSLDMVYLYGAPKRSSAQGDFYQADVYWYGTYSFVTKLGLSNTVHAYCFDRDQAIELVRASLFPREQPGGPGPGMVGTPPQASEEEEIPAILRGYRGSGSGFFIGEEGYFVTNNHVVEGSSAVDIYYEEKKVPARVLHVSKVADLAILKADIAVSGLVLAEEEAEPGTDIYVVGFPRPGIQGIDVKVTKGIVSSRRGLSNNETRFQIDAAIQPGNSGGALCDALGRVMGVAVEMLSFEFVLARTGGLPQNVNYAVKTSELASFLRSKSIKFQQSNATDAQGPRGVGVKMVCAASALVMVKK